MSVGVLMRLLGTLLAFALLFRITGPGFARAGETLELALVIGNNRYIGDETRDLRFADDDALAAAEHYLELHPDGKLWLLVDPDPETLTRNVAATVLERRPPTVAEWERALEEMHTAVVDARAQGTARVHLFLHFSGHGDRGGTLHFADQRLSARSFRAGLSHVEADDVFALMDGCHLAQVIRDGDRLTTLPPPPIFSAEEMSTSERPAWLGLIGATTAVPEHDYLASGLLTLVGLSALRGPADLNGNGRITFREWGEYVAAQFSDLEGGPRVVVVTPQQDRHATVIDLEATGLGGIKLEPGFPSGQVRIIRGPERKLIAEAYHENVRATMLRLKPGKYTLLRLLPRKSWAHPGYPAEEMALVVGRRIASLDQNSSSRFVALLPEGLKGEGDPPPGIETVVISADEERSILNSPFRRANRPNPLERPGWNLFLGVPHPEQGPDLSGTGDPHPGATLRLSHIWPWFLSGRWGLGGGVMFQYGFRQYPELWVSWEEQVVSALHQELRLGACITQTWAGRFGQLGLETAIAYAPAVVTRGTALLQDPSAPTDGTGTERYIFPRNFSADTTFSIRFPLSSRLSGGPFLRAEVIRFQLPPVSAGTSGPVSWEKLLSAGIELRR